jgi:hypothetical protein
VVWGILVPAMVIEVLATASLKAAGTATCSRPASSR